MSRNPVDWYSRGRDAFTEGKPCYIDDARIKGSQRQAWYDGYNHQQRLNNLKKIPEETKAEILAEIADIIQSL